MLISSFDRAFRKYIKAESVPGIFVDFELSEMGACQDEITPQCPDLINAERKEIIKYLKKQHDDMSNSDKENSPNKKLKKTKISNVMKNSMLLDKVHNRELLMCTADPNSCLLHSTVIEKSRWLFFSNKEQLEDLLKALNKRGVRENELLRTIENEFENLIKVINRTPVHILNPDIEIDESMKLKSVPKKGKNRYDDANLGFPTDIDPAEVLHSTIVDSILEMEEKLFAGHLGFMKVKDRNAWRECLLQRDYENLEINLKQENGKLKVDKIKSNSRDSTPDGNTEEKRSDYCDPGEHLGPTLDIESEDSDLETDGLLLYQDDANKKVLMVLASALAQIAYSVDPKYLKKPLGSADVSKKDKINKIHDILEDWVQSLRASTSYSQIFLHYSTLDNCIMWNKSTLLTRCRICRRMRDSENMLLCDGCNNGHHLYCLKPKLTVIFFIYTNRQKMI